MVIMMMIMMITVLQVWYVCVKFKKQLCVPLIP